MPFRSCARLACASSFLLLLAACSNGRGSVGESAPAEPPDQFSVIASVAGLEGSGLVLQNNGGEELEVSS